MEKSAQFVSVKEYSQWMRRMLIDDLLTIYYDPASCRNERRAVLKELLRRGWNGTTQG